MRLSRVPCLMLPGVFAWLQGCDGSTEPQADVQVTATTSTSITGTVGTAVEPAPAVRVTNERDRPLAGVVITFKVMTGGGTISTSKVTTGDDGSASLSKWTLGTTAGTQTLAAGAGDRADVVFTAVAAAGPVAQITPLSGSNQLAGISRVLQEPLVALAVDSYDNPVAGVPVAFTVTVGGGTIAGDPVLTSAAGRATAGAWTLGAEAGVQRVAAVSGGALAVFRAFAVAPPGNPWGHIAFISWGSPSLDIAVMSTSENSGGFSGYTRLTYPGLESQPAWSPDGSRIAFASDAGDVEGVRIGVMTANGANVSWLTAGPMDLSPAWSPDGARIAYTSSGGGNTDLASINLADGQVTVLAPVGGDAQPSWSPDGRKLAFVSRLGGGSPDIYTANADGTATVRLTNGLAAFHPAWSPDGSMIAFVHGEIARGDTEFRVAVMSADGVILKELASAGPVTSGDPGALAWSPDGSGIAFSAYHCGLPDVETCRAVGYQSLDGTLQTFLILDAQSPSWRR